MNRLDNTTLVLASEDKNVPIERTHVLRGVTSPFSSLTLTLDLWPDMPHVFQMFAPYLPEATQALTVIGDFVAASRD